MKSNRPFQLIIPCILSTVASFADSSVQQPEMKDQPTAFQDISFDAALKQAGAAHKIVFVDFYTTWCGPCKMLDETTWKDPSVIALLRDKTIAVRIDAEKEAAISGRYGVQAYPTLAMIRPDGTLIDSLVGYRDAPTFTAQFDAAMAGKTEISEARDAVASAGADPEQLAKARYSLGKALANKGENAEALTEFLWCFDTGMRQAPSYSGVRVSFLLSDIAKLGASYPPALDALRARRDADQPRVSEDRKAANEFGAINHCLGQDADTLATFEKLPADSVARKALGHWIFDLLLEAKQYNDAASAVPAARYKLQFDTMRSVKVPNDMMRGFIVESAAKELEALAGAGKLDDARDLLKSLLEYDQSDATVAVVRSHLERAGHADLLLNPPIPPTAASVAAHS
jgi:thiol-disulfide isomerase/thioredoxin